MRKISRIEYTYCTQPTDQLSTHKRQSKDLNISNFCKCRNSMHTEETKCSSLTFVLNLSPGVDGVMLRLGLLF